MGDDDEEESYEEESDEEEGDEEEADTEESSSSEPDREESSLLEPDNKEGGKKGKRKRKGNATMKTKGKATKERKATTKSKGNATKKRKATTKSKGKATEKAPPDVNFGLSWIKFLDITTEDDEPKAGNGPVAQYRNSKELKESAFPLAVAFAKGFGFNLVEPNGDAVQTYVYFKWTKDAARLLEGHFAVMARVELALLLFKANVVELTYTHLQQYSDFLQDELSASDLRVVRPSRHGWRIPVKDITLTMGPISNIPSGKMTFAAWTSTGLWHGPLPSLKDILGIVCEKQVTSVNAQQGGLTLRAATRGAPTPEQNVLFPVMQEAKVTLIAAQSAPQISPKRAAIVIGMVFCHNPATKTGTLEVTVQQLEKYLAHFDGLKELCVALSLDVLGRFVSSQAPIEEPDWPHAFQTLGNELS